MRTPTTQTPNTMTITRETLRLLRPALDAAIATVLSQHDLTGRLGSATFTSSNATFKLELAAKDATGQAITREATAFTQLARLYDLKPEQLGTEIRHGGTVYRIIGLMPKSTRFPLLCERMLDGKQFKLPISAAGSSHVAPPSRSNRFADRI